MTTISPRQMTPERLKEIEDEFEPVTRSDRRLWNTRDLIIADLLADLAHLLKPVGDGEVGFAVKQLTLWANDPMWADRAEVPRALLALSVDLITSLTAQLSSTQGKLEEAATDLEECHAELAARWERNLALSKMCAALQSQLAECRKALQTIADDCDGLGCVRDGANIHDVSDFARAALSSTSKPEGK